MPKQSVLVATDNRKAVEFLSGYFSDTNSVPSVVRSKSDLPTFASHKYDFVFLQGEWLDVSLLEWLARMGKDPVKPKCFGLGKLTPSAFPWTGEIDLPIDEKAFRKLLLSKIDYPNPVKLVVVDDEPDVIEMFQDYLEVRKDPEFELRTASNGLDGFKLIEEEPPHCLILDIKMPVRTGVELYRDVVRKGLRIPTVIFIDSTSAEDVLEIRRWGTPLFIEKGGPSGAMPDMLALIKKLVAFS